MRDPAVRAVLAIRVTLDEWMVMKSFKHIRRPTWPVKAIAPGSVVGLAVDGEVWGEAMICDVSIARDGEAVVCEWRFGAVTEYASVCPVRFCRGMTAPFEAPMGTLTTRG